MHLLFDRAVHEGKRRRTSQTHRLKGGRLSQIGMNLGAPLGTTVALRHSYQSRQSTVFGGVSPKTSAV
jgi:hypothetical protein